MKTLLISILVLIFSLSLKAGPSLINGKPAGDLFPAVGSFNIGCTITKVGPKHFITAAHCVDANLSSLVLQFRTFTGRVGVKSLHIHPSWVKDCGAFHCDGTEVGGPRMTPGRADVAFIQVLQETPKIPVTNINFAPLQEGTEVAMVGVGCTRGVEPGGSSRTRYGLAKLVNETALLHTHSLYRDIAPVTAQANWITLGYKQSKMNLSLCPGDSGGPLLAQNPAGVWEIVGIAADYTFDGPYRDGEETMTNLHARLDDQSFHRVGEWLRQVWTR